MVDILRSSRWEHDAPVPRASKQVWSSNSDEYSPILEHSGVLHARNHFAVLWDTWFYRIWSRNSESKHYSEENLRHASTGRLMNKPGNLQVETFWWKLSCKRCSIKQIASLCSSLRRWIIHNRSPKAGHWTSDQRIFRENAFYEIFRWRQFLASRSREQSGWSERFVRRESFQETASKPSKGAVQLVG